MPHQPVSYSRVVQRDAVGASRQVRRKQMSASPTAAMPLFIPVKLFRQFGLPGKTSAYKLAANGLLNLVHPPGLQVGITATEALRFFAAAPAAAEVQRDL